jgi:hypothetical protein
MDCLVCATNRCGRPLGNKVLHAAVKGGHLPIVAHLVAAGLPRTPFDFDPFRTVQRRGAYTSAYVQAHIGPDQWHCIQYLFDRGCSIHPNTLISAVRHDDTDFARFLHTRGVPLWDCAWEEDIPNMSCYYTSRQAFRSKVKDCVLRNVIAIRRVQEGGKHMWSAFEYCWFMGAPLTPAMENLLRANRSLARRSTRAVLLCFHVATRLSRGDGPPEQRERESDDCQPRTADLMQQLQSADALETPEQRQGEEQQCQPPGADALQEVRFADPLATPEQRAAWAGMGRLPMELLEIMIVQAGFEIPESICRSPPTASSVAVWTAGRQTVWGPSHDTWEYITATPL